MSKNYHSWRHKINEISSVSKKLFLEASNKTFNTLERSLGLRNYTSKLRDGSLDTDLEFIYYTKPTYDKQQIDSWFSYCGPYWHKIDIDDIEQKNERNLG